MFAQTFDGKMMKPMLSLGHRPMARCELSERRTEAAVRRLLPFLLVKREQGLVLLEFMRRKGQQYRTSEERCFALEEIRQTVLDLHDGSWKALARPLPVSPGLRGHEVLGPQELGWTSEEILAYLAGVMDSDGNLRVEKRHIEGMLGPHYRICIRAAQVAPSPAIDLFARTFGGHVTVKKVNRPNQRDLAYWSLHDKSAVPAIAALLPYLLVKRQEAYLLLDLRRLKAEGKKGITEWVHPNRWHRAVKMRKRCYTPEQVAEFERIKGLVEALHSGVSLDAKSSSSIPPKPGEPPSPPNTEVG